MKNAHIPPDVLWCLLLYSMRYAMGRMSSAPGDIARWIIAYRSHLSPEQIAQMAEEIETELRIREARGDYLGAACDHETWRRLAAELRK